MAAQGRAAVGHQADARRHHTSRSVHLRQCGAGDNQIDQDELFDCHVNNSAIGTDSAGKISAREQRPDTRKPTPWRRLPGVPELGSRQIRRYRPHCR
ncbi:hypothetical protein MRB56_22885 [Halomonas cupida]|uniref:hypothetical protein n=1 Tax=Halomonas cupida TaxID=44933 RepID=UPI001160E338|nr:hypothetical protein [Halomonas cupida]